MKKLLGLVFFIALMLSVIPLSAKLFPKDRQVPQHSLPVLPVQEVRLLHSLTEQLKKSKKYKRGDQI